MPHVPMWLTCPHTGLVVSGIICVYVLSFKCRVLKIMVRGIFCVTVHTLCDSAHTLVSLSGLAMVFVFASFVGVGASPFHVCDRLLVGFAD